MTRKQCCAGDAKLKPAPSARPQSLADSLGLHGKPDRGAPSQTLAESLGLRIRPAANARPQSLADSLGLRWGRRQLSAHVQDSAEPLNICSNSDPGAGRVTQAAHQASPCYM